MDFLCVFIVGCLSLQAHSEPPAITATSSAYNEHSTLPEYVAATQYIADETHRAALGPPAHKPFEGYWMDDPVRIAAAIDEYNVDTVSSIRPAAKPRISTATFAKSRVDGRTKPIGAIKKAGPKRLSHRPGLGAQGARRHRALPAGQGLVVSRIKLE